LLVVLLEDEDVERVGRTVVAQVSVRQNRLRRIPRGVHRRVEVTDGGPGSRLCEAPTGSPAEQGVTPAWQNICEANWD
jgi:hypothetical protein